MLFVHDDDDDGVRLCACEQCVFVVCLDGLIGLAVVGGAAAVALGGIVGLGIALTRK